MNVSPESLAEWLEENDASTEKQREAANMLRELHKTNQRLLGALRDVLPLVELEYKPRSKEWYAVQAAYHVLNCLTVGEEA